MISKELSGSSATLSTSSSSSSACIPASGRASDAGSRRLLGLPSAVNAERLTPKVSRGVLEDVAVSGRVAGVVTVAELVGPIIDWKDVY